jgi:hypothetical protein
VKPKVPTAKIGGPKLDRLEKIKKNDLPAPTTYDSPASARRIKPNHNYSFSFSKKKKVSYLAEIKPTGPAPGSYDLNKSESFITKGAAKGWK